MSPVIFTINTRELSSELSSTDLETLTHNIIQQINSISRDDNEPFIYLIQPDQSTQASKSVIQLAKKLHQAYYQKPRIIYQKDTALIAKAQQINLPQLDTFNQTANVNKLYQDLNNYFTHTLAPKTDEPWQAIDKHWVKPAILKLTQGQVIDDQALLKIPFHLQKTYLLASKKTLNEEKDAIITSLEKISHTLNQKDFNEDEYHYANKIYQLYLLPLLTTIQQNILAHPGWNTHQSQIDFSKQWQKLQQTNQQNKTFAPRNTNMIATILPDKSYYHGSKGAHRTFFTDLFPTDEFFKGLEPKDLPSYLLYKILYNHLGGISSYFTQLEILTRKIKASTDPALMPILNDQIRNFKKKLTETIKDYRSYKQSLKETPELKPYYPYNFDPNYSYCVPPKSIEPATPVPVPPAKSYWSKYSKTLLLTAIGGAVVGAGLLSLALFTGGTGLAVFAAHIPWIHIAYSGLKAHAMTNISAYAFTSGVSTSIYTASTLIITSLYEKYKQYKNRKKTKKTRSSSTDHNDDNPNTLTVQHPKYKNTSTDALKQFPPTEKAQLYFSELAFITEKEPSLPLNEIDQQHPNSDFINYSSQSYQRHSQEELKNNLLNPDQPPAFCHVKIQKIIHCLINPAPPIAKNIKNKLLSSPQRMYEILLHLQRQRIISNNHPDTIFSCRKIYTLLAESEQLPRLIIQDPKILELFYYQSKREHKNNSSPLNNNHRELTKTINQRLARSGEYFYKSIIKITRQDSLLPIPSIHVYFEIHQKPSTTEITQRLISLATLVLSAYKESHDEEIQKKQTEQTAHNELRKLSTTTHTTKAKDPSSEVKTQLAKARHAAIAATIKTKKLHGLLQTAIDSLSSLHSSNLNKEITQFCQTARATLQTTALPQSNTPLKTPAYSLTSSILKKKITKANQPVLIDTLQNPPLSQINALPGTASLFLHPSTEKVTHHHDSSLPPPPIMTKVMSKHG
jgi:hypothetical protein